MLVPTRRLLLIRRCAGRPPAIELLVWRAPRGAPLEEQRRQLQEIVGAAAKALINRGVPTRVLPDADTPFYYARNSWDTEQRIPWNAEAGRPMSLAEGIAWLHDNGS